HREGDHRGRPGSPLRVHIARPRTPLAPAARARAAHERRRERRRSLRRHTPGSGRALLERYAAPAGPWPIGRPTHAHRPAVDRTDAEAEPTDRTRAARPAFRCAPTTADVTRTRRRSQ